MQECCGVNAAACAAGLASAGERCCERCVHGRATGLANQVVMQTGLVERMCSDNERLEAAAIRAREFLTTLRDSAKAIESSQGRRITRFVMEAGGGVVSELDGLLKQLEEATATSAPRGEKDDPQGTEQ